MIHTKISERAPIVALIALAAFLLAALPASAAEFGIVPGSFTADAFEEDGVAFETQAGAHPHSGNSGFVLNTVPTGPFGTPAPVELAKDVSVLLPEGFAGNPTAIPRCESARLTLHEMSCPVASQVGSLRLALAHLFPSNSGGTSGMYNMEPNHGELALFAGYVSGVVVRISIKVRPEDGYRVRATVSGVSNLIRMTESEATLWGVPADPSHDRYRCSIFSPDEPECTEGGQGEGPTSSGMPLRPFLSNPTSCGVKRAELDLRSWKAPDVTKHYEYVTAPVTGCHKLPFDPQLKVRSATVPDAPAGLAVGLRIPQTDNPDGLATAHLKDAVVRLPEGMTINPAAADGLAACTDAELKVSSSEPVRCPEASRIASVVATSPALEKPVGGSMYVGSQLSDDPRSGQMFRIFMNLVDEERGLNVKLPGSVRVDPDTGRIETSFESNPQLPVETVDIQFKEGSRSPLATPATCGRKTTTATLTSWAGHSVDVSDSFDIPCPTEPGFAPAFDAGSLSPAGGAFSPFVVRIDRDDRERFLSGVEVDLPKGLLAKLRGVPLCGPAAAENGGCPAGSRIGTATVGAGAGSPFYVQGYVYLTEGYRGAPYGLATHVHAKAGPFDLGWVRVRQAIHVDPSTAELRVVSDPLPQIVKGVPVRLRSVNVDVDRPNFAINPTSCAAKQVKATLTSVDGAVHRTASRFQASDCAALRFSPKIAMRLAGKNQTRTGGHPALSTVLTQAKGQANIAKAKATLPPSVALDAQNSFDPKLVCDYDKSLKADCPASSIIGKATALTPVLNKPLRGKVHLVQGIKFGPKGNRIRTTPALLVKLRGEVAIDLRAQTTTEKGTNRLITTFPAVPDAPVSKFSLTIDGGKKGILVVTRTAKRKLNLCSAKQVANVETDGQNGKSADFATAIKTPCAKNPRGAKGKRSKSRRRN